MRAGVAAVTSPPFAWVDGAPGRAKVTQCALSRVCGGCGQSLGRPIAFLGTASEVGRNAFHAPPLHASCAEDLRVAGVVTDAESDEVAGGVAGEIVLTAGFEFVRPARDDADRRPTFVPNSLL